MPVASTKSEAVSSREPPSEATVTERTRPRSIATNGPDACVYARM